MISSGIKSIQVQLRIVSDQYSAVVFYGINRFFGGNYILEGMAESAKSKTQSRSMLPDSNPMGTCNL